MAQIDSKSEISAPDIDIDTETTSENLEIEDESLKTVDIDFSSKDEESFKIQPPSIEFNTESIHKTLGDKINSEEIEYSVQYFGNLHVSVSNAKDLEKKDFFQKADPYVVISLGSQTFKSQKVKNNLNPEWNHEVTFSLDQHSLEDINIIIYDWDRFGKDDPMGNAILDLHYAIKKSNKGVFCLPLENCKSGQIFISTRFDGETRKKQITLKGVTDLKKYLSDNTELDNKTLIQKRTTIKRKVIRKTIINAEGKEETIEEIIEEPEVDDESKIIEKVSLPTIEVDDGTEVEEIKIEIVEGDEEISSNDGWTKIPIIRLDNNQVSQTVEIEELSDEDQEEPIDLTNKLQVEGVVSTPSDEEFSQESTNIQELDDEPLDLSKKHKPLSNESSISSTSSSVITVIGNDNKPKLADDCDESPKWSVNIPIIRNLRDKDKASSKEYDGDVRVGAVNIPIIRVQNEAEKSKEKKEIIDEESFSEGNKEPLRPDNVSISSHQDEESIISTPNYQKEDNKTPVEITTVAGQSNQENILDEIIHLEEENKTLKAFVPDDIIDNLPAELQSILVQEISVAREHIVEKDLQKDNDTNVTPINMSVQTQDIARVNIDEPRKDIKSTDLEDLLKIVSTLDEDASKFVYEELQAVLKEVDNDLKQQKINSLKEDLIKLQIEQTKLMPSIPAEVSNNLPQEIADNLNSTMKTAILNIASKSDEINSKIEINDKTAKNTNVTPTEELIDKKTKVEDMIDEFLESDNEEELEEALNPLEVHRPETIIASSIPEELLQTIPPEMAEILKANFESSVMQLSNQHQEIDQKSTSAEVHDQRKTSLTLKVEKADNEDLKHEHSPIDIESDDVSLPPTPAVQPAWSFIASQPVRPNAPTPNAEQNKDNPLSENEENTENAEMTTSSNKESMQDQEAVLKPQDELSSKANQYVSVTHISNDGKVTLHKESKECEVRKNSTIISTDDLNKFPSEDEVGKGAKKIVMQISHEKKEELSDIPTEHFTEIVEIKSRACVEEDRFKEHIPENMEENIISPVPLNETVRPENSDIKGVKDLGIYLREKGENVGSSLDINHAQTVKSNSNSLKNEDTERKVIKVPNIIHESAQRSADLQSQETADDEEKLHSDYEEVCTNSDIVNTEQKRAERNILDSENADVQEIKERADNLKKETEHRNIEEKNIKGIKDLGKYMKEEVQKEEESEIDSLKENEDKEDKIDSKVPQFIDKVVGTRADAEPSLKKNNVELELDVKEEENEKEDKVVNEIIHESIKDKDNNDPSHQETKNFNIQNERNNESVIATETQKIEDLTEGNNYKMETSMEGKVETASAKETKNYENKVLLPNVDKTNKSANETGIHEQHKVEEIIDDEIIDDEIIEDADIVKISDEELLHIDNLKSITDHLKEKIATNNQAKNNYIFETRTFETVEEIQETVAIHLKDAKAAISRKQVVVIQQTIITIVETVSNWLDKVEYKISTIKRIKTINQKKEELKNIKDEIEVIEETVDELVEVTDMAVEVMNDESKVTISSCVNSLSEHVKIVKLHRQQSEDELSDSEDKWDEYLEGVKTVSNLIQDLRTEVEKTESSDNVLEEKVEALESLQTMNKGHMNKVKYLIATGNGLASDLQEKNIPEEVYNMFENAKKIDNNISKEKDTAISLLISKGEYEQTLSEYENLIEAAEFFINNKPKVLDIVHLNQEIEKQQKFFINLSHCLQVLQSLQGGFSDEVKNHYSDQHHMLNEKSEVILNKAAKHINNLSEALNVWSEFEIRNRELFTKLQETKDESNNMEEITTKNFNMVLSKLNYHKFNFEEIISENDKNRNRLLEVQNWVISEELSYKSNALLNEIHFTRDNISEKIEQLDKFSPLWKEYEQINSNIHTWIGAAEDQIENEGNLDLLYSELLAFKPIFDKSNNSFADALAIYNFADDEEQRKYMLQTETRWVKLTESLESQRNLRKEIDFNNFEGIQSDIENTLKQIPPILDVDKFKDNEEILSYLKKISFLKLTTQRKLKILGSLKVSTEQADIIEKIGHLKTKLESSIENLSERFENFQVLLDDYKTFSSEVSLLESKIRSKVQTSESMEKKQLPSAGQLQKDRNCITDWNKYLTRLENQLQCLKLRKVQVISAAQEIEQVKLLLIKYDGHLKEIEISTQFNIKEESDLKERLRCLNNTTQETLFKLQLNLARGHIDLQRLKISTAKIKVGAIYYIVCISTIIL